MVGGWEEPIIRLSSVQFLLNLPVSTELGNSLVRSEVVTIGPDSLERSELKTEGQLDKDSAGDRRTGRLCKVRAGYRRTGQLRKKGLGKVIYGDGRTGWLNIFRLETKGPDSLLRSEVERGVLLLF